MDNGLRILDSGREMIKSIYGIIFPDYEKFGLQSQIRRAAVSVNLNVTEGNGRQTSKDFIHFCYMAKGSLEEVKECLYICNELKFIDKYVLEVLITAKIEPVMKQLHSLIRYLKSKVQNPESNQK